MCFFFINRRQRGQTVWPLTFLVTFTMVWAYSVQKSSHSDRSNYSFISQDGDKNVLANQDRKATAFLLSLPPRSIELSGEVHVLLTW